MATEFLKQHWDIVFVIVITGFTVISFSYCVLTGRV
jgi:hypothetical protein